MKSGDENLRYHQVAIYLTAEQRERLIEEQRAAGHSSLSRAGREMILKGFDAIDAERLYERDRARAAERWSAPVPAPVNPERSAVAWGRLTR